MGEPACQRLAPPQAFRLPYTFNRIIHRLPPPGEIVSQFVIFLDSPSTSLRVVSLSNCGYRPTSLPRTRYGGAGHLEVLRHEDT
jgi:hypothetical protein